MANTVPNPYNYQTPLGQALGNALQATGTALATGPSQWDMQKDQAAINLYGAQAGEARAKTAGYDATNAAPGQLAAALRHAQDIIAAGGKPDAAYNTISPEMLQYFAALNSNNTNLGDNFRSLYSLIPGATDQGMTTAQEGAGQAFNTTPLGTREGFVADQQKQNSLNTTSRQNNEADNAMRQLIAQMEEAGRNNRFSVNTGPDTLTTLAPGNPLGQTSISGPSIAIPKANIEAQTSRSNNAVTNATTAADNTADNAMHLLVAQLEQKGQSQRMAVQTAPGTITSLPPDSPIGKTTIQGIPTQETAKGAMLTGYGEGGVFDHPNEPMVPGSPAAVLSGETGVPGQKTGKNWITNDGLQMGITLDGTTDAATGKPLPAGAVVAGDKSLNPPSASTGKNWASPDGQRGVTNDGKTNATTGAPLPTGWQYSTDVNPSGVKLKVIPAGAMQQMVENKQSMDNIDKALAAVKATPGAIGAKGYAQAAGSMGMNLLNWADPDGVSARALIANIGSLLIHQRAGGSVTVSETPRLQPFIPLITDNETTVENKLSNLRAAIKDELSGQADSYSEDSGYIQNGMIRKFLDTDTDPRGTPLSVTTPADIASERADAQAAITKGADAKTVKDRFKQRTGQDF